MFPPTIITFGAASLPIAVQITSSTAMSEKEVRDLAYFNVRPQLGHVRVNVVRINDNRAVYLPL